MDFGHLIEGRVELDDTSGRYVIRDPDSDRVLDVQEALKSLDGFDVRLTLISLRDLSALEEVYRRSS